jgi:3'-phosphoadenosine 5'-phosphosulfate sulfotransferase (PAPS reductase)/FAD synthetase
LFYTSLSRNHCGFFYYIFSHKQIEIMKTKKIRHVLGISGGKDSTALAIYLRERYPSLEIEYYFCDTGKELDETYDLLKNLEVFLGKKITYLQGVNVEGVAPFDHFLKLNGGYLPSSSVRWCTRKLKLAPFEKFIGDDLCVSYVGIRGDEDREGYVSTKPNIQTIFPFRKNMWSKEMINKLLKNSNIENLVGLYDTLASGSVRARALAVAQEPISAKFPQASKLNSLLDISIESFNRVMFAYLRTINSVVGQLEDFPLLDNEDILAKDDIFRILRESGVGMPQYYTEIPYEVEGLAGTYHRSRSGCFFCFYQQKIEWIWLYEQHPDKFAESLRYEKDGFTWIQDESLADLVKPERMAQIKKEHLLRTQLKASKKKSPYLLDILEDAEEGCLSCFV